MAVRPIPEGFHSVTPYLILQDTAAALDFYKRAFGATELVRMPGPGGKVMHAEMKIGDSILMMADAFPDMGFRDPKALGGTTVSLALYVADVDARFNQAVAAGGKVLYPVKDQFYGDRSGTLTDPFGHVWTISTHKEDLSPEEIGRRMAAHKPEGASCSGA
jgi:PhnB protein